MMPSELKCKWASLEKDLSKATGTLLSKFSVQGEPPPLPSTFEYKEVHMIPRHLRDVLARSRDAFSLWIGALAFAIALSQFMDQEAHGAIPAWYHTLRQAGLSEMWVDGLRTSPMVRFDGSTLRVGVLLDILSPQQIQASVDWLCGFNVPVWYPWGRPEAAAALSNPALARLAPLPHQLQNVSLSFFTKEVGETFQVAQPGFDSGSNKRPLEAVDDEARMSKRPRQHNEHDRDPWGGSRAITWHTNESNPWGDGNWPVSSELPSNHTCNSDLQQEQPRPVPRPSLTENVVSYEPFFARRKERNERIMKSENAKEKQRRLNRERVQPKTKTLVFEWEKNDNLYSRVKLSRSQAEDAFDMYRQHKRRYDAFANEWDLCHDFEPLDERQLAEDHDDDDDDDDEFPLPSVPALRNQTTLSPMDSSPSAGLETQTTTYGAHNVDPSPHPMDQIFTHIPETSAKNSVVDLPSTSSSLSGPPRLDSSVADQGASVPDDAVSGDVQGPSPSTEEAIPMFGAPRAMSFVPIPQIDPSGPASRVACDQDVVDISQNEDEPGSPILSGLDYSLGNQGTSDSHTAGQAKGQSQNADEMEARPSMSAVPTIPQLDPLVPCSGITDHMDVSQDEGSTEVRRAPDSESTDEMEALPSMSVVPTTPQVDPLVPCSDVSQDEGSTQIHRGPDSDFSWPISSSMTALVTAEEISGNELQDEGLTETRLQASSFSWPVSSSLLALITASEDVSADGIQPIATLETYNTTSILHNVFGFIHPTSASPQPSAASMDGPTRKKLQVSVGLDEDEVEFLQSPLARPALEFLERLSDAKSSPTAESSDLAEGSLQPLRNVQRLRQLRAVGSLYVFDFKTDATLPWMIGVATAAIALYIVRLDSRWNDYEISRHLLHQGIAFHTLLRLRKIPKSPILRTFSPSIRSAGYVFTVQDFDLYVHRRDSLLRSPRGRAALLKGGIVWRLAVGIIGIDECLEGPSIETVVHRRGLIHPTADPDLDLCDDDLSLPELDLICGVYECMTGIPGQTSIKSWFPLHSTWATAACLHFWSDRNHFEFERRTNEILGGGQPLTATQWAQKLKANSHTRRLKSHNEKASKDFIKKVLAAAH